MSWKKFTFLIWNGMPAKPTQWRNSFMLYISDLLNLKRFAAAVYMQNQISLCHPDRRALCKTSRRVKVLAQLQSEFASRRGASTKRPVRTLQKFNHTAAVPRWTKIHTVSFFYKAVSSKSKPMLLFNFFWGLLRVNGFLPEAPGHTTRCGAIMRPRLALCLPQLRIKAASKVPLQNKRLRVLG